MIERADAKHVDSVRGEVKFCDISFQYKDGLPLVLNGVDLHIKAGEIVALVGPSGGGKTTLAKLLLRLYDPLHGELQQAALASFPYKRAYVLTFHIPLSLYNLVLEL